MVDRKAVRFTGVKTAWSSRTRETTVAGFEEGRMILAWRNLYQYVAAGPKTADGACPARAFVVSFCVLFLLDGAFLSF